MVIITVICFVSFTQLLGSGNYTTTIFVVTKSHLYLLAFLVDDDVAVVSLQGRGQGLLCLSKILEGSLQGRAREYNNLKSCLGIYRYSGRF
uniref:Uncharacterized protein n=1 Tax=Rhodnius prolixus TaxID=13249 RepID=T1IDU7_RHOPR